MKNKIFIIITLLLVCSGFTHLGYAQEELPRRESLRDRLARRQAAEQNGANKSSIPQLSVRAEQMNQLQTQDVSNATWVREVYRMLDLEKGANAALYYPVQPMGNRMNLFTMIFKLMAQGDLVAYDFLDGMELFTDQYKVKFKDVLDRLEIAHEQSGNAYYVNDMDIPSNEALAYYVKEAWYFDQSNSVLDVKIVAICPVLTRMEDAELGLLTGRSPQFWIPYENIRPYAARMPIMTSDLNNATTKTIDDYFRLRLYDGEIYKTTNMENKILREKYPDEEQLKAVQAKIETQLKDFDKSLWVINDSIKATNIEQYKNKSAKKQNKSKSSSNSKSKTKKSSSPTYSARDRR